MILGQFGAWRALTLVECQNALRTIAGVLAEALTKVVRKRTAHV